MSITTPAWARDDNEKRIATDVEIDVFILILLRLQANHSNGGLRYDK
jgi:hypothetical protein